ncbi:MAG: acyl-CoA desaturase [Gammaproteobacteria bacterium HGW-Gammaproteobacteria-8]|nr:MAG: acyl-CoA desaturase [Gammaproteobacteria bacterium HGW-Gammaproteobacteria-8]
MELLKALHAWFDTQSEPYAADVSDPHRLDLARVIPFIGLHLACLGVLWVGVSPIAVVVAMASYLLRMFAITAFYHRYFSHRAFRASRPVQFAFALIGAAATQRGPLWWAAHHRRHHKRADRAGDPHTPRKGLYWSHMGWFLSRAHFETEWKQIPDLAGYRELRWLDRYDILVPVIYATAMFGLGTALGAVWPESGTSGLQMLVWGYFISTVVLIHVTLTINSLAHCFGSRRFETPDDSRNNIWLAILTLGEGWHNNHHHFPGSARQGFYWWELDLSYLGLRLLERLGLVRDLKPVPEGMLNLRRVAR